MIVKRVQDPSPVSNGGMVEHIIENPQFIVNGFIRSGISSAIDGVVDMGSESEDDGTEDFNIVRLTLKIPNPLIMKLAWERLPCNSNSQHLVPSYTCVHYISPCNNYHH